MFNSMINQAQTIAISGHVRPDGDCVGSCLGLYLYLKEQYTDKKIDLYLEKIPPCFEFLKGAGEICHEISDGSPYDLFLCLDCGDVERLGFSEPLFHSAAHTFVVDHHISNEHFAEADYVKPDASSASELIFDLLDKEKLTKDVAEALFVGLVHDTGVFQYSCAGPSTFRAAAVLLEKGIDASHIIHNTFYEKSIIQQKVLGYALKSSNLCLEGKGIYSYFTWDKMQKYGAEPKDFNGVVSLLRDTEGVEISCFMYELNPGTYKVSLRAGDQVDVNKIANIFGGGGHVKAAGFTIDGEAEDIIEAVMKAAKEQLGVSK